MSMADHHTSAAAEAHSTTVHPALPSGATSGATAVNPGTGAAPAGEGMAATSAAHAEGTEQPAHEGHGADQQHEEAGSPKTTSLPGVVEKPRLDGSVGYVMAVHCALTSLSVTASVVIFDYAMDGGSAPTFSATLVLLCYAVGDLIGRMFYESLLGNSEHRKVMALQAFLQGGVLFIMAATHKAFLLAPIGFGLGGISSSLDMLPVPVLQRYIEPDAVERKLGISRAASGIGCLLGPVLVMIFRDGLESYVVLFIVSGLLSVIAGALWLPGLKREMDEARGKTAAPGTPEATAGAKPDVGGPDAAAEHSPLLPGAHEPAAEAALSSQWSISKETRAARCS
ncbi:hypothetical protein MTO96_026150 [Rhipicephalus appendiculatus]